MKMNFCAAQFNIVSTAFAVHLTTASLYNNSPLSVYPPPSTGVEHAAHFVAFSGLLYDFVRARPVPPFQNPGSIPGARVTIWPGQQPQHLTRHLMTTDQDSGVTGPISDIISPSSFLSTV